MISITNILKTSDRLACLAAKLNTERNEWLPLWVHSLDTCGVAECLLEKWLPESTLNAMSDGMTYPQLMNMVRTAAVFHDLGKSSILFQSRLAGLCPEIQSRLLDAGLPLLAASDAELQQGFYLPHAAIGEIMLLMNQCPLTFSEVIGAHHGQPWPEGAELIDELQEKGEWLDPRAISIWGIRKQRETWQSVQKECLQWMLDRSGCTDLSTLPPIQQPTAVLVTGLIIMADWIASNEEFFPLIPLDCMVPDAISTRIEHGWKKLDLPSHWIPCKADSLSQLCLVQFGFEPNAMQTAVMQAVKNSEQPGMIILEAPMGLGKTEAALLAADLLAEKGVGGIFFGLPTQATSNAIFDRIVEWAEQQPDANRVSIRLAHGMADMNARYRELMPGNRESAVEEDAGSERLVVHEWFRGRKQALLADFVVGTVDQVLMSALRQKHVMLRHLGLCGKAVIIDECHAYDAYMNQYLEEALRWLGSYHTPVIMLSATLPAARRADFLSAYLNQSARARKRFREEKACLNQAYPILTWTDANRVCQQAIAYDGPEKNVRLTIMQHDETLEDQVKATIEVLSDALQDGGCAAVVLNTVQRAQYFSETLKRVMPDSKVLLLHSRFVISDRLEHEHELLHCMGKKSGAAQRDRVIIVGTQVIEQSLDFDADLMITDLCPMDLLMQRIGRLHRHAVHDTDRPERMKEPKCYILCAGENLERGAEQIYGGYLLMRTRALLPESAVIPVDIPRLVNQVYDETFPLPVVPEGYAEARQRDLQKQDQLRHDAEAFRIHSPDALFATLLTGSIPSDDEHARAQVRAGSMSMDVLLMMRQASGALSLLPWIGTGETWSTEDVLSDEEAREILAQRISLPQGLILRLEKMLTWEGLQDRLALPTSWENSRWLKRMHLLILDESLQAGIGGIRISYHRDIGLQWEKEREME